jgi:hypothetical protein
MGEVNGTIRSHAFPRIRSLAYLLGMLAGSAFAAKYDPGPGRTVLLVGQTFTQEFKDYVTGVGRAPGGSSHYGELYTGAINQGDDGKDLAHLKYVQSAYPHAYAMIAISWKDNPDLSDHGPDACGGYTGRRIYQVNRDIVQGRYDAKIDSFAAVMKRNPGIRFYLRIEYEVSRYLFSWKHLSRCPEAGKPVDFGDSALIDNAAYRQAYNHVARRIREVNAVANVDFVYHPVRGFEDAQDLYPGPEFVDFIALSLFNDDLCINTSWCKDSLDPNARKVLEWARKTAGKPIMIAESAAQPPSTQSDAGMRGYLSRLLGVVKEFDVRVLTYINSDWNAHGWDARYWGDSRVESRPEVKAFWKSEVLDNPRYLDYSSRLSPMPWQQGDPGRNGTGPWFFFRPESFRLDGKRLPR